MKQHNAMERLEQIRLKSQLARQLRTCHPPRRKTWLENLSELVAALTQARHVQLSKIAEQVQPAGDESSREQWVRRQLRNQTMETLEIFQPLAPCLLGGLTGKDIRLILAATDLSDELWSRMIALAYQHRVLPVAWITVEIKPGALQDRVTGLFTGGSQGLPADSHVYLIADRECRGMARVARIQPPGWSPSVRCQTDLYAYSAEGLRFALAEFTPQPGQTCFLTAIRLTEKRAEPFQLSRRGPQRIPGRKWQPWFILSSESPGNPILKLDALSMWIAETFRDLKSYGFHLDQTGVQHTGRIDRLVLILVLAGWWLMNLGRWLDRMGLRRHVDRTKHGKLSVCQLGLRFANRQLHLGKLPDVQLIPTL